MSEKKDDKKKAGRKPFAETIKKREELKKAQQAFKMENCEKCGATGAGHWRLLPGNPCLCPKCAFIEACKIGTGALLLIGALYFIF